MTLSCPNCHAPNEVQDDCLTAEVTQAVCRQCEVNLVCLGGDAVTDTADGPSDPAVESAGHSGQPHSIPRAQRQRRLGVGLSLGLFLVNLSVVCGLAFWSLQALKVSYDPYRLDQHFLSHTFLWASGWSELHIAAARDEAEKVRHLLDEGDDVNVRNARGRTPLFESAKRGHTPVVQMLLERGAEADAQENDGITPLMEAAQRGHVEVVETLITHGAALDSKERSHGRTALHLAAWWNQPKVALSLLRGGADTETADGSRQTALHVAASQVWHENGDVAAILIKHGADLEVRDNRGSTPLIEAASHGHVAVISLLMDYGAQVNAKAINGKSALYLASRAGHRHIAKLLLDGGADANARCNCSSTPLHQAVKAGDAALVGLLLDRGADVNARVDGKTPLHLAEDRAKNDLAQVLRDHGGETFRDLSDYIKRARAFAKNNDYVNALALYDKALDLSPADAELLYLRGATLMKMGAHDRALEDLDRSLAGDPSRFDAYIKLAYIYSTRNDWDPIIDSWNSLLHLEPENAKAYYERGRVYFRKGVSDPEASRQALSDTLKSCILGYQTGCRTYSQTTGNAPA